MSEMDPAGAWLPLMDYAHARGLSVSTLRRYIKSNKVKHRLEKGRYLIWLNGNGSLAAPDSEQIEIQSGKIKRLTEQLKQANEEIAELKTLLALYEEKIPQSLDHQA